MKKKLIKKPKRLTKAQVGGTYSAFDNRLSRTYGNLSIDPEESIDTSGFGKGKKEFTLTTSSTGFKPKVKSVKRGDVMGVISKLKKGATRIEDYRSPNKKKK